MQKCAVQISLICRGLKKFQRHGKAEFMRQKIPPNRCRIPAGEYFKFGIRFAECLVGVANADVFLWDCLNKAGFRAVFVEGNDGFIIFPVNSV